MALRWPDVERRFGAAHNYWLGTASPDGAPHTAPVWGLWHGGGFVFSTDPRSRKGRNLLANPRATAHVDGADDVLLVEGDVQILVHGRFPVPVPAELAEIDRAYAAKYTWDGSPVLLSEFPSEHMFVARLTPEVAHAWTERDFLTSRSRWERRAGVMTATPARGPG
jgi:hypothetical protein